MFKELRNTRCEPSSATHYHEVMPISFGTVSKDSLPYTLEVKHGWGSMTSPSALSMTTSFQLTTRARTARASPALEVPRVKHEQPIFRAREVPESQSFCYQNISGNLISSYSSTRNVTGITGEWAICKTGRETRGQFFLNDNIASATINLCSTTKLNLSYTYIVVHVNVKLFLGFVVFFFFGVVVF